MFSYPQNLKIIFLIFLLILIYSTWAEYTDKERVALDMFRPLVLDSLTHDYQNIDSYLIRWIRAKEFNLVAAAAMLHRAQKWRKENNIDNILNTSSIFEDGGYLDSFIGSDLQGNPFLTLSVGRMDIRRLILEGKHRKLYEGVIHLHEKLALRARETSNLTGTDISQAIFISDLNGYNRKQHLCVPCVSLNMEWAEIPEKYYPGFFKFQILLNVPRIYDFLSDKLKGIQSPHVRKTLKIFGHNKTEWSAFLDNYIAPDQRSYQLGGTRK